MYESDGNVVTNFRFKKCLSWDVTKDRYDDFDQFLNTNLKPFQFSGLKPETFTTLGIKKKEHSTFARIDTSM